MKVIAQQQHDSLAVHNSLCGALGSCMVPIGHQNNIVKLSKTAGSSSLSLPCWLL